MDVAAPRHDLPLDLCGAAVDFDVQTTRLPVQTGNRDKHQDADEHLADCHQPSAVSKHEGFRSGPHRNGVGRVSHKVDHVDMRPFRELVVWQKAHHLTLRLYSVTRTFPREEQYGLLSQTRRCAASICANVAEGCGRGTARDFARFIQIALGSSSELEYHILLAADLGYLTDQSHSEIQRALIDVKRMLSGLLRRLIVDGRRASRRQDG